MEEAVMLSGKTALVTGASSGLGWQFARVLAAQGARVAVAARRVDKLSALVEEIARSGGEARAFSFDALDPAAPDQLIAAIDAALGTPDILVNNAGISLPARAHKASLDQFEQTMAVNVRAPWRLSQLCAGRWIDAGREGVIVNVASMLSTRVAKGVSLYTMSKAAIRHMTAGHALEWAKHGIRVNALCPGYIRTSINEAFWESDQGRAELGRLPRPRTGIPSDLDSALLFLVDPRSRFVNGESVTVDDAQSWAI
ncbi:SDR family oxidoreductase [Paracoccus aestuarii]|uniref:SDR family oxidoreductase n=1 Tax=Paracoccus aestuarii TaxID=453842 RepID=A0A418ZYA7_9RHOB|nr:SDR family oxidoreductase [Paracoccus aestuarii]RJL05524.1 SDR family oxidoreductase [Paracoccus aestuarii]WCQ98609.1 SDR family oxidoreductase [Paracoccus aestuarii]